MGTKINHERFLQSNRVMDSRKSGYAHRKEIERLENTITMKQRKYHGFLAKLCDENGIPPSKMGITSKECSTAINTMKQRLAEAGVEYEDKTTYKRRKYRFDKDGNVVEIKTGKIVRKRT